MGPVLCVVGARPNFMKMAPLCRAFEARSIAYRLVHTGQHYDEAMSSVFFDELRLPRPHFHLGVGSGSHATQTARVMLAIEPILEQERPACVVVVGDVNSTLGAALAAGKRNIPVAHVEAGLRSFDRTMPEEINRILTDQLAEVCLTPSADADLNLAREGIASHRIACVGNLMIDTLLTELPAAWAAHVPARFEVEPRGYGVVTLHRPSNVDDPARLRTLFATLLEISRQLPLLFLAHPRTRAQLEAHVFPQAVGGGAIRILSPLGYRDTLGLVADSRLVLTDSGGLQEETTVLSVPCLTLRESTERPITIDEGTNVLCGTDPEVILGNARAILEGGGKRGRVPALWDGHAAGRVVDALEHHNLVEPLSKAA